MVVFSEETSLSNLFTTVMKPDKSYKTLSLVFTSLLLGGALFFTSCSSSNTNDADAKPRLAFVTNGVAPFWTIAEAGALQAKADFDIEVDIVMPSGGITDQKDKIEDLITRKVDGIALSPIDAANQTELINKAAERTNVITHDSDAPESNRLCYIGMDNHEAGLMCAELVKKAIPDGGKVMIFVGRMEQDNAKHRRQGLLDGLIGKSDDSSDPSKVLQGNGYTILGTLTDQFDRAKAKANVEDTLSRHGDIACMVGLFEYNPPLILEVLEQAGKLGQIKVVGFDENDRTLQGIKDGHVQGTIAQDPYMYGYKSMEYLYKLVKMDPNLPKEKFINVPAQSIEKSNVDEFWTTLKKRLGKDS